MDYWPTEKDPQALLDYKWDWKALTNGSGRSNWLGAGEIIDTYQVTLDSGLTLESDSLVDGATGIVMWVSGGVSGEGYKTHCRITTNQGRIDERTRILLVRQR